MRALGLALLLLAIPTAGAGLQQQEPTEPGKAHAAELPADVTEAGPEDRLGFLLTLTVPPEAAGLTRSAPHDDERRRAR